jgi:succinyl-CoA synthetase alpha subunit
MSESIPGLLPEDVKLLVQGITGREGSFHTKMMIEYGTKIVGGVTPGKGGLYVHDIPVFDTVVEAVEETGANSSIIFVPAKFAYDAALEAIHSRLSPIVIITEGIPAHDTAKIVDAARKYGVRIIGPNTPGLILPGKYKIGILPHQYFREGEIAVVSRSGTLTYEISMNMLLKGYGQRIVIGCGGDYIIGTNFIDVFEMLRDDDRTKALVVIGEIGGDDEERLAQYIMETDYPKPVIAYIAGRTAPPGKKMGHAGAIISGGYGTADSKINKFKEANVKIAYRPSEVAKILSEVVYDE